jgi:hypothetical protein
MLLALFNRTQPGQVGDELMESSPFEEQMSSAKASRPDVIGKVFLVRSHGLRECLICGELLIRTTAPAHAEVNCYPVVEFCLREPNGGKHGSY